LLLLGVTNKSLFLVFRIDLFLITFCQHVEILLSAYLNGTFYDKNAEKDLPAKVEAFDYLYFIRIC